MAAGSCSSKQPCKGTSLDPSPWHPVVASYRMVVKGAALMTCRGRLACRVNEA